MDDIKEAVHFDLTQVLSGSILETFVKIAIINNDNKKLRRLLVEHKIQPTPSMMNLTIYPRENVENMRLLLEHGADPNGFDGETTLLMRGLELEHNQQMFDLLIEYGADINYRIDCDNLLYYNAFEYHFGKSNIETMNAIIAHPTFDFKVQIHKINHPRGFDTKSIITRLIENGWDINTHGYKGRTLLHNATFQNNKEIVIFSLENKADIFARCSKNDTPLHYAFTKKHKTIPEILIKHVQKYYPEQLSDFINAQNTDGNTALHYSVISKSYFIMELLINLGADIFLANTGGFTAYDLAQQEKKYGYSHPWNVMRRIQNKNKKPQYLKQIRDSFKDHGKLFEDNICKIIYKYVYYFEDS